MKLSIATFALCFANAAVVHAQDGGKKSDGSPGTPMMLIGGKKGMSMPEFVEPTECPAVTPLTCGAEETGSTVMEVACGDAITASGLYTLSGDLTCPSTAQFAIAIANPDTSDVTLDCQGNTISQMDCAKMNLGIFISGAVSNVVVKNCNVECFDEGLNVQGSNVLLKNINASNNGNYGVNAPSTNDLTIVDSTFSGNSDEGIAKSGGSVTIVDTVATMNGGNGIAIGDAGGATTAFLSGVVANNNGFDAPNNNPLNGIRIVYNLQSQGSNSAVLQNVEACGNDGQDIFVLTNSQEDLDAIENAQSGTRCDCNAGDSGSSITCDCDAVPMDN